MKTLTIWMLGLALPLLALAPACNDEDDDGDSAGDDDGDDDDDDDGDDDGDDDDDDDGDDGDDDDDDDDGDDDGAADDGAADDGAADDGAPVGGDVGDQCMSDSDCAENACIFAGDVDYGFCSTVCDSFADCPAFWDCVPVGNASANYCVPSE
jgi:hypothetical protein